MKRDLTHKNTRFIEISYIVIMLLINAIGAFLPTDFNLSRAEDYSMQIWRNFIRNNQLIIHSLKSSCFFVPLISCIIYINPRKKEEFPARFINYSFRCAGFGCIGWLISFLFQTSFALYQRHLYGIIIGPIIIDELFFSIFLAFMCFTLSYFVLDLIHRKFVLPKYFPEGKVHEYPVRRRATVFLKMRNFYISVALCPIFYVLSCFIYTTKSNNIYVEPTMYIILGIFMFLGIVLLVLSIEYLNNPLVKLKQGARKIEQGDYSTKIDFISSDDFGELTDAFNDMTNALQNKDVKIQAIAESIYKGMALMVESRDVNTGGHINRTSACVKVFAEKLMKHPDYDHIENSFFNNCIKAAPMHDLGKITVEDEVLRKPGKYTSEEYEKMKRHSAEGAKIIAQVLHEVEDEEFKKIAINVAHYHHEKWNGEGYPVGLEGEEIPLEARIMALADVFDALVSKRCYKDSFTYDKAFSIIEESLGTHFDPFLGLQFLACRKELEELYNGYLQEV